MRGESGAPDVDQSKLQPSATPCANGSFGEGTSAEARDGLSNAVVMLGVWGTDADADAETETGRSHLNCRKRNGLTVEATVKANGQMDNSRMA